MRELPKPLVEIGELPILWHVIQLYAAQGFKRFLLATGYRGELIERFAAEHEWPAGVQVRCVDTGRDTPTGGRVKLLEPHLGGERFCLTYADGLADIDLGALLAFPRRAHGALATMTVVRPRAAVRRHRAGRRRAVACWAFVRSRAPSTGSTGASSASRQPRSTTSSVDSVLERGPLERLARDGQLHAYRHDGFWECMDTYKDAVALNDLWASGAPPWRALAPVAS